MWYQEGAESLDIENSWEVVYPGRGLEDISSSMALLFPILCKMGNVAPQLHSAMMLYINRGSKWSKHSTMNVLSWNCEPKWRLPLFMWVTSGIVTGTASVGSDFIPSLLVSYHWYAMSGLRKTLAWIKIKLRNFTYHLSSMLFTRIAFSENLLVYIYVWLMRFESTQISLLPNTADQFTC